jgi:N-acyl-D-amino-acid deacylase
VIDGSGAPGARADVGISGKTIESVGDLSGASAARTIDASGLTVTPGFIDTHAHSDAVLLTDPQHANGIRQGVTTEIICQDGMSFAPLSAADYRMYARYLSGILGRPPENLDMSSIAAFRSHYHERAACNVVALVPHGPLRLGAVGFHDVPLRGEFMEQAKRTLREGIEQGARGLSTGLSYYPQSYSDTEELIELNRVVAELGGVYVVHVRNHNVDRAAKGGGIAEALEIGRRSGVKVHVSHYRTNGQTMGKVDELMAEVDAARAEGVDVTLECYPYPVGSTIPGYFFPGAFHDGGPDALLERLADPGERERMVSELRTRFHAALAGACWSNIGSERNRQLEGMTFEDAAELRGVTIEEMVCDVMLEEQLECGFRFVPPGSVATWRQLEADVMQLLERDDYMVGSDAIAVGGLMHPRAYGCFPRVVGRLRRRLGYPLEQVVQRVTQAPAQRFGLTNRGVLREGSYADVAVFDAERITDLATFEDPAVYPVGIPYVVVNGQLAVDGEQCTGVLAGEAVP